MSYDLFDPRESDSTSWDIAQVTLKDEGYYECIAISNAGTGRAHTFLDVSGKHTSQNHLILWHCDSRCFCVLQ